VNKDPWMVIWVAIRLTVTTQMMGNHEAVPRAPGKNKASKVIVTKK